MQIQYTSFTCFTCFTNTIHNYEPMTIAWVDIMNSIYKDVSIRIIKL